MRVLLSLNGTTTTISSILLVDLTNNRISCSTHPPAVETGILQTRAYHAFVNKGAKFELKEIREKLMSAKHPGGLRLFSSEKGYLP